MSGKGLLITGLSMLAAGVIGLVAISFGLLGSSDVPPDSGPSVANGESIFYTAADSAGRPIPYQGGMMMRMACADCHGGDGYGRVTMMFISPNITYRNLTDPAGMLEPNGERGATYTDETIKRAITEGVDAKDKRLDWPMPRWRMSERELDDLIAFLKTLP